MKSTVTTAIIQEGYNSCRTTIVPSDKVAINKNLERRIFAHTNFSSLLLIWRRTMDRRGVARACSLRVEEGEGITLACRPHTLYAIHPERVTVVTLLRLVVTWLSAMRAT